MIPALDFTLGPWRRKSCRSKEISSIVFTVLLHVSLAQIHPSFRYHSYDVTGAMSPRSGYLISTQTQRDARAIQGQQIRPRPCRTSSGGSGVCMFVWDCSKRGGIAVGICTDRFMFGGCCQLPAATTASPGGGWTSLLQAAGPSPPPPLPTPAAFIGARPVLIGDDELNEVPTGPQPHSKPPVEAPRPTTHWERPTRPTRPPPPPPPHSATARPTTAQPSTTTRQTTTTTTTRRTTTTATTTTTRPPTATTITTTTTTEASPVSSNTTEEGVSTPWPRPTRPTRPTRPPGSASSSAPGSTLLPSSRDPPLEVTAVTPPAVLSASTAPDPDSQPECGVPPLFPDGAGSGALARIVGGRTTPFGGFPWQLSVRRTSFFGLSTTHRCGGALLNEQWAATAAHCVDDLLLTQIRIRVGEYDFGSLKEPHPYQERTALKKIVHPNYNFYSFEHDLALVKLDRPVTLAPNVYPICLPGNDDLMVGDNATITGWGRLSEGGVQPGILQQATVPILENSKCKNMFKKAGRLEYIPDIFLCAGFEKGGTDACQGDSGGPLQVRGKDGRWFLAGIISWGIGCAEPNLPGVSTRISKFTDWILEKVAEPDA